MCVCYTCVYIFMYIHVRIILCSILVLDFFCFSHTFSRGFSASGASPASAATGYIDGYSDSGHGSSGPMHYPSSNSPWSHKALPHGGSKSQVRNLAFSDSGINAIKVVFDACMSHVLWCIYHFICVSVCTCRLMHIHTYSCTCTCT